ncbi:MAG: glucosamine-6-phosphate deaminase, partial [Clostridia bacterium]|nr:glucosamine-6-phosphate deaminase [Clostridia bacterium]
ISMGIADILHAKKILLIASGANKAQAVYDMVAGPVSSNCPASFLQLHPDCTIVIDKGANSILQFE